LANELVEIQEKSLSVFASNNEYKLAHTIATELSRSDLVPTTYKGKVSNCIIALDIARQVRNSPLIVMQNLNIIKGKPAWSSTYISGVIHSRFKNVRIESFGTGDEKGKQVFAVDSSGNLLEGAPVTIGMAKAEGWFSKKDKDNKECSKWQTMPDLMLQYRAMAFFGRVHCPDALIGLHSEFEVYDTVKTEKSEVQIHNPLMSAQKEEVIDAEFSEVPIEETLIPESSLQCSSCGVSISGKVNDYSTKEYGKPLCMSCQKLAKEGQI
jgi:hypothetical protein